MADTIALIEAYLAGTLTEEEHHAFAERLSNEAELKEQLQQFADSRQILEQAVSLRLKKQMQQMQRPQVKPLQSQWLKWSAVAVLAILLLASGIWWNNRPANSYEDYFEPYSMASGLRGEATPANSWEFAYQQKDYAQAQKILAEIAHDETAWVEAQFYLGNIALAQNKPAQAIKPLSAVLEVNSARFQASAEWYLLLAYWGSGDKRSAKQLAQKILANPAHSYQSKTQKIRAKLED